MSETADSGPLTPGQVRWLKISVVVMGIMIVVGIAILIGRVLYLATTGPRSASAVRTIPGGESTIALPAGATVRNLSLSADRLAIHHDGPNGAGIVVVDLATGAALRTLTLVPEVPRAPR